MSKRLIIMDPLISDWTGHCAEYAVRVLDQAKKMNLDPVLVCSRGFKNSASGFQCLPIYSYENSVLPKYLRWIHYLKKWKNQLSGSRGQIAGRRPSEKQVVGRRRLKQFFHTLQAKKFSRETQRALTELKVTEDDIIFIPNAIYCVLLGVLKTLPKFKNLKLHIVFHFEFFTLVGENENGIHHKNIAKNIFSELKNSNHNKITLYTDTEHLTHYYRQFDTQFKTLPIPVSAAYQPQNVTSFPLRIHYVGAARSNKGYHYLPELITALKKDYLDTGKIQFAIQSNLNNIEGDALALAARSKLEKMQCDNIQLITQALSPERYQKHVLDSDIVLIPYDANEYINRSSGIFAECMSAGIPVIVPDNSWMADQIKHLPIHSVGKIYQTPDELIQCVEEIIQHYSHYQTSANEFSKNWCKFHNPRKLIEMLYET